MTVFLDHGVDDQFRGTGGVVVGQPDQALVFGFQEVSPILRSFEAHAVQFFLVDHEAEDTLVDTEPVTVSVAVHRAGQVNSVFRFNSFEEAFGSDHIVRVGGAAEPDISRRVAVFFFDLGLDFTGGKTLIGRLDTVEFLEMLGNCSKIFFFSPK